jgi:high frequency lysogenization protein
MIKNLTNQTIALAGLNQAILAVHNLAKTGTTDADDFETCIASLLKINADDVPGVFGGVERLKSGLRLLERQLGPSESVDTELARYAAALVYLEGKFKRMDAMQKTIRSGLERATTQTAHFGLTHDNVIASIADLYQNNISQINPRIMVMGENRYLENPAIANKIRALLLAGIRSAWLWRQCGGSKLGFLLSRRKLHDEAKRLVKTLSF